MERRDEVFFAGLENQVNARMAKAVIAAQAAFQGNHDLVRDFLITPQADLDGKTPFEVAASGWDGVDRVARLLK